MGEEITRSYFHKRDFSEFAPRLREETARLQEWFNSGAYSRLHGMGGFEVECWLVEPEGAPAPVNDQMLERLNSSLVVPELARFNVEINTPPRLLQGDALRRMHDNFARLWRKCDTSARTLTARLAMLGILPTAG